MSKLLNLWVLCSSLIIFGASSLQAEDENLSFADKTGLLVVGHTDVNLISGITNTSGDSFISYDFSVNPIYFFHKNVGAFSGLEITQRGFDGTSPDPKVHYLDIPFGLSFAYRGFLGDSGRSFFNLGGFYGVALGDYDNGTGGNLDDSNIFGLAIRGGSLFAVTEKFSLGFNSHLKFGLNDTFSGGSSNRSLDLGIGLSAGFMALPL